MKTKCFTPNFFWVLLLLLFPLLGQAQNSNPCDDGDPNTIDLVDGEGNCFYIQRVCKEGEPTTITLTIPSTKECQDPPPCNDDDPSTLDIVDYNGDCHHIPFSCDDSDPTTRDYVDENGTCINEKIVCDDGDPETEDYLDEFGVCHHVKIINECNTCEDDKEPPVAECKDITVKLGSNKMVEIWTSEIDNGSYDECGDVDLWLSKTKFDCGDLGWNTVTLTVKDKAGNQAQCYAKVKVTDPYNYCYDPCEPDETAPIAKCKDDLYVKLGEGGMQEIWTSEIDNGSYDECGEVRLSIDKTKFTCDDLGWNTVTLTVKDKKGNKAYCTTKVKVSDPYKYCYDPCDPDETAPWAECKDQIIVKLDKDKKVEIWPSEIDNGSKDDCSEVTMYIDKSKFYCSDLGWNTVTLTVKDKKGNKAYCTTKVKVTDPYNYCYDPCDPDETAPWAKCKDQIIVKLDKDKKVEIWTSEIDNGSKDDCSEVTMSIDKSKFYCSDLGWNTVTLTVKDKKGNKAYCTTKVKVTDPYNYCHDPCDPDETAPWAECKEKITVKLDKDKKVEIWPSEIDNGSKDDCSEVSLSIDKSKFDCDDLGWNTVTLTVKDKKGNKAYCTTKVMVTDPHNYCYDPCKNDEEAPKAKCKAVVDVKLGDGAVAYIDSKDIDNGSYDNCGEVWLSLSKNKFDCDDLGWNTVKLTAKDKAGNSDHCYTFVKVTDPYKKCSDPCDPDHSKPWAECKEEITVKLGEDGIKNISVFDVNNGSKDDCSEVWLSLDKTRFTCDDLGTQRVTLTVKDKANNKATCTTKVKVTDPYGYCQSNTCDPDNEAPVAKCKDLVVELDQRKEIRIKAEDVNDGSYDNCGDVRLSIDNWKFACQNIGSNWVELTVKDEKGNTDKCEAQVVVTDPKNYCGYAMEDCNPDDLDDCEIAMSWYTCTTLKICIGKFEFSNIRVDFGKKGYQNDDIDFKLDNLKGNVFYFDVRKYGMPKGFWIKSSNNCGKCGDDDDDDEWEAAPCPRENGAGKYYEIPERDDNCEGRNGPGVHVGNANLQQSNLPTLDNMAPMNLEPIGPDNFEQVTIFPNPSTHKVFVSLKGFEPNDLRLQIFNSIGEQLKSIKTTPSEEPQDLEVDEAPAGLYYLRIVKPNGEFIAREFVIKR